MGDADSIATELQEVSRRMDGQLAQMHERIQALDSASQRVQVSAGDVDKRLVGIETLLKVQSGIGILLIGFLGWLGVTLFQLNGTTSSLDTSTKYLAKSVEGLQSDMRDLRRSIDRQVASK